MSLARESDGFASHEVFERSAGVPQAICRAGVDSVGSGCLVVSDYLFASPSTIPVVVPLLDAQFGYPVRLMVNYAMPPLEI
jgi:hypothetical protein